MEPSSGSRKGIVFLIILLIVIAIALFAFVKFRRVTPPPVQTIETTGPVHEVIGKSVQGRNIDAYTYGTGTKRLLFVGGIHGGYEWNSVLLAYTFMDYLNETPAAVPANLSVTVIPSANPDAVFKVVGKEGRFTSIDVSTSTLVQESARFNANEVDLNRNFDCKWQPQSTWRSKTVSAGTAAFSEPEALAIKNFVTANKPEAAVFWHSQSNAVYASQCNAGILPGTLTLMNTYANSAGYPAVQTFDAYVTTGAADDWMAAIGIPAITVELSTHETIEWDKNAKGVNALFTQYSK